MVGSGALQEGCSESGTCRKVWWWSALGFFWSSRGACSRKRGWFEAGARETSRDTRLRAGFRSRASHGLRMAGGRKQFVFKPFCCRTCVDPAVCFSRAVSVGLWVVGGVCRPFPGSTLLCPSCLASRRVFVCLLRAGKRASARPRHEAVAKARKGGQARGRGKKRTPRRTRFYQGAPTPS